MEVVTWGTGSHPEVILHPGVTLGGHSLERYPPWRDTDDCSVDYRHWPYPNPGSVPIVRLGQAGSEFTLLPFPISLRES